MPERFASHHSSNPATSSFTPPGPGYPSAGRPASGDDSPESALAAAERLVHQGRYPEAAQSLRRALDSCERGAFTDLSAASVLSAVAAAVAVRCEHDEAAALLERSRAVTESALGPDHPDVGTLLNGLARLHLKAGNLAAAEPVLERLLRMKSLAGEQQPEVATVLASLAAVHGATGRHESAERLWRRVLAIRERTLAPNHFATATTLEHLAGACAARGKFDEAVSLLHRALVIRELTLGTAHPSILAARAHIADIELLASSEEAELTLPVGRAVAPVAPVAPIAAMLAPPPPAPVRVVPEPLPRPAPAVAVAVPPMSAPGPTRLDVLLAGPPIVADNRELGDDDLADDEAADLEEQATPPQSFMSAAERSVLFLKTPRGIRVAASVGVTALVGALVLAMSVRADGARSVATSVDRAGEAAVARAQSPEHAASELTPLTTQSRSGSLDAALKTVSPTRSARGGVDRVDSQRSTQRTERSASDEADPIRLPHAPAVASFSGAIDAARLELPAKPLSIAETEFAAAAPPDLGSYERRAELEPGSPAPKYPRVLLPSKVEGKVVAQFLVDANGVVDLRTLRVISSDNERFTQAVRDALPLLRFRPAMADGRRVEDWVQMPFTFAIQRK